MDGELTFQLGDDARIMVSFSEKEFGEGVRTEPRAYLELTGAMVLVGSSVVAGKLLAESLPVFLAGGLSSAIGAVILLPVLFWREGGLPVVGRREAGVLFLQAFTGIFLFRVLLLWGMLFTSPAG